MSLKKAILFLFLFLIVFAADGLLKACVYHQIPLISLSTSLYPYGGIGVFQDWHGIQFSIIHVGNKGAAWGAFSSMQDYLLYARMVIIGGLLSYLLFVRSGALRKFSLALVLTGACGNVLDYFIYGHVIDMFYFVFWGYSYPVFNIADSAIFIGIVLIVLESLMETIRQSKSLKSSSDGSP